MDAFAADALAGRALARPIALSAALDGRRGERPRLTAVEPAAKRSSVEGGAPLEAARTAGLSADKARRAIGALGGTPYELRELRVHRPRTVCFWVWATSRPCAARPLSDARRAASGGDRRRAAARRRPVSGRSPRRPAHAARPPPARQSARRPRRRVPRPGSVAGHRLPAVVLRVRPRRGAGHPARHRRRVPRPASRATTSSSSLAARTAARSAGRASRCGCARPRCCSTADDALGCAPWRPSDGMPHTPVTSRR